MSVRFEQVSTVDWNIDSEYEIGTKVKYDGGTYVSVKNVPKGINISFNGYWKKLELKDDLSELAETVDGLSEDVSGIEDTLYGEDNDGLVDDVGAIIDNLTTEVSDSPVVFKFAYNNGVYGFMVGDVFHPFGNEVPEQNGGGEE